MDKTKGYNSYRGRTSTGRLALVAALVLVLLGALAYLAMQNYLVYDESGQVHLALPFLEKQEQGDEGDSAAPVLPDEVEVERIEPEFPHVKVEALHAVRLPDDCLWWGADYILNTLAPEDMVLAVKRTTGGITYATEAQPPAGVTVETGRPIDCLKTLLSSGRYTVGQIVCFSDSAFARALPESALVRENGSVWYDGSGQAWLDPTDAEVLRYLTALCSECGALGFNEVLLDAFTYPATGQVEAIANDAADRTQALTDVAKSLRAALPEGVALSVTCDGTGELSVSELADLFDRLYVPAASVDAVKAQLPADFDTDTRLVTVTTAATSSGSYVVK